MAKIEPTFLRPICQSMRRQHAAEIIARELQIAGAEDGITRQEIGAAQRRKIVPVRSDGRERHRHKPLRERARARNKDGDFSHSIRLGRPRIRAPPQREDTGAAAINAFFGRAVRLPDRAPPGVRYTNLPLLEACRPPFRWVKGRH